MALLLMPGCERAAQVGDEGVMTHWGNDVLAAGSVSLEADTVPGDLMMAGPETRFGGHLGGDYLGAGGRQEIGGVVLGNVRASGGEIRLTAEVIRNVSMAGGRVEFGRDAVVGGNAYLAGGAVRVGGTTDGHLRVAGGDVRIEGAVEGDVSVDARHLAVAPGARIGGALRYRVPDANVSIAPEADVAGEIIALEARMRWPGVRWWHLRLLLFMGFLVAGAALTALFAGTATAASDALTRWPGASVGFGLLWALAVPVAVVLLAVTLVGIPLALIAGTVFAISLYLGRAVPSLWLGRWLLGNRGPTRGTRSAAVVSFLLGAVLLLLAGLIPWAGPLVTIAAAVVGVGGLVAVLWKGTPARPVGSASADPGLPGGHGLG